VRGRLFAGLGLVATGAFLPLAFALEATTRPAGTDGDNAAESLVYLQEHGLAYALSGWCLLLASVGLIRAATAVPWRTPFLMALGSVAGGLWAFTGALRISSPGPIGHIADYDRDWGEAAYLVVQMAGTQGGLLAGAMLAACWVLAGCWVAWRSATLPPALCLLGAVSLGYPLGSVVGLVLDDASSALWLLSVVSLLLGVPVWFLASGLWTLTTARRSTPEPFVAGRD
jgi:hypothetical protein